MRYALRSLAGARAFSVGALVCLSVGLTLTIAAFSVINAVFFRSMPGIRDQSSLRHIWVGATGREGPQMMPPSLRDSEAFRTSLADVADVAAAVQTPVAAKYDGAAMVTRAVFVSRNYFDVLGTTPLAGRVLHASESEGAVVGELFWRRHLGARPDVLGRALFVNGHPFTVVGIAPAKFVGASPGEFEDDPSTMPSIWLPVAVHPRVAGSDVARPPFVQLTARLSTGTSDDELASRANALAAALPAADGQARRDPFARVKPIHRSAYNDDSDMALAVSGILAVPLGILAIGCANVANLLLARGTARSRETAVRLALGASRARIVRELLAESLLLAGAAAAVAVGLCALTIDLIEGWIPIPVTVDWRVASFAGSAAILTALLFGLLPALGQARSGISLRLHDARPLKTRTRRALVGFQLAVSTALLVIAALFVRTVTGLAATEHAEDAHVLRASFAVHLVKHDGARMELFEQALLERVRAVGGIRDAGIGPYRQREGIIVRIPGEGGRTYAAGGQISDGWLSAAGRTLQAGRDFAAHERRGAPMAAIINESLARRVAPAGDALGKTILVSRSEIARAPQFEVQIVGIVRSGDAEGIRRREQPPTVYLPVAISDADERTLIIRTEAPAVGMASTIRAIGADVAPNVPITTLQTAEETRREAGLEYRILARAMSAAGVLALLLAAFGLFSLLTYLVAQRRRELGIRLALGATREDIVRLVVGESAVVAIAGAVLGGIAAAGIALTMRSMFVGVGPADPVSYAAAAGVLVFAALAASAHPAVRASRTDPASVLRTE